MINRNNKEAAMGEVERFTKAQFEAALPVNQADGSKLWESLGLINGEQEYAIPVYVDGIKTNKRVHIRSSITSSGIAGDTGENSIRLWAEYSYHDDWRPLAKLDRWTTRTTGWEERMIGKLRELYKACVADERKYLTRMNGGKSAKQDKQEASRQPLLKVSERTACQDQIETVSKIAKSTVSKPTTFEPSPFQQAVFRYIREEKGHLVIEAVAGSGKTTTIVEALKLVPSWLKVGFVAFNRRIVKELTERAPAWVYVSTLHSLGLQNLRSAYNLAYDAIDPKKLDNILKAKLAGYSGQEQEIIKANQNVIKRMVSLCKATLMEPTQDAIQYLSERYHEEVNGDVELITRVTAQVFETSVEMMDTLIDYDDMIYASAMGMVPCRQFDVLMVDELQDLNRSQIEMALRSAKRIIGVGDRNQSIYGFRGADTEAIPRIIEALGADTLPLSITYRCPKSHVDLAHEMVPEIQAAEWAEDGIIASVQYSQLVITAQSGDLVLCRCNAPLVKPAFACIRQGKKAVILGRDIASGLIAMLDKIMQLKNVYGLVDVLAALTEYRKEESAKLEAADRHMAVQALVDKEETIVALSDGCFNVDDLKHKITDIFSDEEEGIVFSSVHKAKGSEAKRVFIVKPELMPHPNATSGWEMEQERNIKYVAYTRSKSELYFVQGEA